MPAKTDSGAKPRTPERGSMHTMHPEYCQDGEGCGVSHARFIEQENRMLGTGLYTPRKLPSIPWAYGAGWPIQEA